MSYNRVYLTVKYNCRCDVRKKVMADKLREKFEPLGKFVTLEILGGNEDESEPDEEDEEIPPPVINEKAVAPPPPPPKTAKPKKPAALPMPSQDSEDEDDFEGIFAPTVKKVTSPKTNKKPEPLFNSNNQVPPLVQLSKKSSKRDLKNNDKDEDEDDNDEENTKTLSKVKGKKPDPSNVTELINFLTDCSNCIEDIRDQIFVNTNLPSVYTGKVQLRDCTIDGKFEVGSTV